MVCTPEPGIANWIRFVLPAAGAPAFDAVIAWRKVQVAPQTAPAVSAVEVMVKVSAAAIAAETAAPAATKATTILFITSSIRRGCPGSQLPCAVGKTPAAETACCRVEDA